MPFDTSLRLQRLNFCSFSNLTSKVILIPDISILTLFDFTSVYQNNSTRRFSRPGEFPKLKLFILLLEFLVGNRVVHCNDEDDEVMMM